MEYVGRPAVELAGLVQRRQAKPSEIVAEHLDQVDAMEPRLHAFLSLRGEKALAEARELDDRPDIGELPLAGVPIAMKDSVAVAGEPMRLGSLATSDAPDTEDDELTRRVRAAGAVVIGKTRQPELAIWHFTDSNFGTTRNPWNLERTPGGSSGGAAAAVASAMIPLAQASDGAGSIRIPAAFSGLFGIKPGPGVVPLPGGKTEHWFGMSQWGPLATTVADGALLLDVLAGTDRYREVRPPDRALRVAVSTRPPVIGVRTDRQVRRATETVADGLREAGHTIILVDPPYSTPMGLAITQRFCGGLAHEVDQLGLPMDQLEPRTQTMARLGRRLLKLFPVPDTRGEEWCDRFTAWFADYDLLVLPTTARPWVRADGWLGKGLAATFNNAINSTPFTSPWNLASFPAASVPGVMTEDGFPIGTQIVAPRGGEALVLSLAKQVEELMPWP
ncbi:MAG: amidase family protein, partial [Candidatus Dormibacteraeota bacterium]|nr:amidase family protein [Candidatus Dormibacteraeota bacterium]